MADTQAQIALEQLRLQRAALADFGLFAFQCNDIDAVLTRAVELVSEALDVPLVKVLEHLPREGKMLVRAGVNWERGVVGHETFADHRGSPGGYALRAEHPVVSTDLDHEDRFETPDMLRRHGVRSMVNVIIAGEAGAFGVLEVDAREQRDFGEDEIAFLRTYANLLAGAIERIRSHHELRRAAREQGVLARELGHRVKNLLGLIKALASLTPTEGRSAQDFRTLFVERLQALSAAEDLVFGGSGEQADLGKLAEDVLAPYRQDDPGRIRIEGGTARLSARRARMFGLALHELATNAAKYGALCGSDGTVRLAWHVDETPAGEGRISLIWQERGGPAVTPPDRKGFGTRLLQDVIAHELNGEAKLVYESAGFSYELDFPVERP